MRFATRLPDLAQLRVCESLSKIRQCSHSGTIGLWRCFEIPISKLFESHAIKMRLRHEGWPLCFRGTSHSIQRVYRNRVSVIGPEAV